MIWSFSSLNGVTSNYVIGIFKGSDRQCIVIEQKMQLRKEFFSGSFVTYFTAHFCSARMQIQPLKTSFIVYSGEMILRIVLNNNDEKYYKIFKVN